MTIPYSKVVSDVNGVKTLFHRHADGSFSFERRQEFEEVLADNHNWRGERQKLEAFHKIGEIPNIFIEKWMNEDGVNPIRVTSDELTELCVRKLRNSDWARLRTTERRF